MDSARTGHFKATKACLNCRRQKMKCRIEEGETCRRCKRSGAQCIFMPRANSAATLLSRSITLENASHEGTNGVGHSVLQRLRHIEEILGIHIEEPERDPADNDFDGAISETEDSTLAGLWATLKKLKSASSASYDPRIFSPRIVQQLWLAFHDNMPGLHFLPSKQTFTAPTPLLLAAMLYLSSARGSPELAALSSDYFNVMTAAIASLCIPRFLGSPMTTSIDSVREDATVQEEYAFQNVLGIILAGLISDISIRTVGIWIAIGYRLILEHCPAQVDDRSREWRRLFSGLQIVDLEHASLHMTCPVVPLEAPLTRLHMNPQDQLQRLSRMLSTGVSHFSGRGIPSIWSYFSDSTDARSQMTDLMVTFTGVDSAVIRDWARQLDGWLAQFSAGYFEVEKDRVVIFRQYILQRLLVLSIYLPARGFNLFDDLVTLNERHELLVSARAALKLNLHDQWIWANFDLVMITWAALIVLQGVSGGVGEEDDLANIEVHIKMLRETNLPEPSFRHNLAGIVEKSLQSMQTPPPPPPQPDILTDWNIFDEMSLQTANFQTWQ